MRRRSLPTCADPVVLMSSRSHSTEGITAIGYDPRYRDDFVALNEHWVEKYFEMEAADRKHFEHVEEHIIAPGGDIVFLIENEKCLAACALIRAEEHVLELAKMAVLETELGRGLGSLLMEATLKRAREMGARKIVLRSNTTLAPAIGLYKKYGFKTTRLGPQPDYDRADIEMTLDLTLSDS
jgi:putative acetyltransferase